MGYGTNREGVKRMKSILIIDTPVSKEGECPCYNCRLKIFDGYWEKFVCQDIAKVIYNMVDEDFWDIYKNCPLKSLIPEPPADVIIGGKE